MMDVVGRFRKIIRIGVFSTLLFTVCALAGCGGGNAGTGTTRIVGKVVFADEQSSVTTFDVDILSENVVLASTSVDPLSGNFEAKIPIVDKISFALSDQSGFAAQTEPVVVPENQGIIKVSLSVADTSVTVNNISAIGQEEQSSNDPVVTENKDHSTADQKTADKDKEDPKEPKNPRPDPTPTPTVAPTSTPEPTPTPEEQLELTLELEVSDGTNLDKQAEVTIKIGGRTVYSNQNFNYDHVVSITLPDVMYSQSVQIELAGFRRQWSGSFSIALADLRSSGSTKLSALVFARTNEDGSLTPIAHAEPVY